jgi:hypothetical protein
VNCGKKPSFGSRFADSTIDLIAALTRGMFRLPQCTESLEVVGPAPTISFDRS